LLGVGLNDEVTEGRPVDDFDEFIDRGRRTNQSEPAIFDGIRKLMPPALKKGTD